MKLKKVFLVMLVAVLTSFLFVSMSVAAPSTTISTSDGVGYVTLTAEYTNDGKLNIKGWLCNLGYSSVSSFHDAAIELYGADGELIASETFNRYYNDVPNSTAQLGEITLEPGQGKSIGFTFTKPQLDKDLTNVSGKCNVAYRAGTTYAMAGDIKVFYKGDRVQFGDVSPVVFDGSTLVPARALVEKMGATVTWDNATKTVTIDRNSRIIKLVQDSNKIIVNDQSYDIPVSAKNINGRVLVPLRVISEYLDCYVFWGSAEKIIGIYQK